MLFWLPDKRETKPAPNSIPLIAPIESFACANIASNLLKTGSPKLLVHF